MSNDPSTSAQPATAPAGSGPAAADGAARTRLGRDSDNDIVIDDLQASRRHAELRRVGNSYQIVDLGSRNGTFLNGRRVLKATALHSGDLVSIGRHELLFDGVRLHEHVDTGPASIVADDLTVRMGEKVLIDDVSFSLREGSLLALIGPSGCGKSTLLKALTGLRPATQGRLWYGGHDLYADYAQLRYRIGMVPQDDVLHKQLKVRTALRYAAALRFADDVPRKVRWAKVNEVMETMRLTHRAKARIDVLSGGQRKRASVAMELLTEPSLLCLDEPTSGLDPALDKGVMTELRELADKGKTVVVVTHSVLHLDMCDRVLVMCLGGTMGYFGPPDQLLDFFGAEDYADVFTKITDEPERWTRAFRNSPLYARYVSAVAPVTRDAAPAAPAAPAQAEAATEAVDAADPVASIPAQRTDEPTLLDTGAVELPPVNPADDAEPATTAVDANGVRIRPNVAAAKPGTVNMDKRTFRLFARNPSAPIRQYFTLCLRMLNVIFSDRGFSMFLLAMPLILAGLSYTVPGEHGLAMQKIISLEAMQLLVVLVTGAAFIGTAASMREIVNEAPIYARERAVGLSAAAYLSSKLTIFFLINTAQVALFVYLALFKGTPSEFLVIPSQTLEIIVAMVAVALVSTVLGLLISALARTSEQTTPIMVVVVMAQLVFSGGLFLLAGSPVMEIIAWVFPTRWGFSAAAATTDVGKMLPKLFQDPLFTHSTETWWRAMIFIGVQLVVLTLLTRLAMRRLEPGRS
ncbi:ATP-binding cassette domain-containing protein [Catellatospora sp. KI3]|uniref:ATP-binding cassette domain-containing protein n=1 Tax=Catellatospora sp. KI3 TaxID=3041620 RepID=UPI002482D114|nr:ATP-binding cassette domain-containing protein [Catellatospora sp. KI3]MDI1462374.1 ATP-binding cassette domain-containing protein [Catellatospora sp. KI3]